MKLPSLPAESQGDDGPGPIGGPLEWRWIGTPWRPAAGELSRYRAWVRPRFALPDDRGLQQARQTLVAAEYGSAISGDA